MLFALLFLGPADSFAQNSTAETAFTSAIAAFQKNDFNAARAAFNQALSADPSNPIVLFNLGLTEQKAGHNGLALALWRKALASKADFEPAQRAISSTRTKLDRTEIPHELELYESLRSAALTTIPLSKYLAATAVLLALSGWLTLGYWGRRRRAQLDEKPMPGFPVAASVLTLLFVLSLGLSAAKAYDDRTPRGTVISKKIEARSAPDAQATPLFDLYEGLEVIVQQTSVDWVQVTYPGGSTGWIPRNALLATNDSVLPKVGP